MVQPPIANALHLPRHCAHTLGHISFYLDSGPWTTASPVDIQQEAANCCDVLHATAVSRSSWSSGLGPDRKTSLPRLLTTSSQGPEVDAAGQAPHSKHTGSQAVQTRKPADNTIVMAGLAAPGPDPGWAMPGGHHQETGHHLQAVHVGRGRRGFVQDALPI